jgi:trimethylamine-N-oxide reductase (cytochrome c)
VLKFTARRHPAFAARLKQRNLVAQIKARDEGIGRWISFRDGKISSGRGMHAKPDVTLSFKNATIGASLLTPPINWLDQINAQKDFTLAIDGPEDLTNWLAQTLMMMQTARSSSMSRTARLSVPRRSTSTKPIRSRGRFMRAE